MFTRLLATTLLAAGVAQTSHAQVFMEPGPYIEPSLAAPASVYVEPTLEQYRSGSVIVVAPPGNRNFQLPFDTMNRADSRKLGWVRGEINSPEVYEAAIITIEDKYQKMMAKLRSQPQIIRLAKQIAPLYGIDPIHVVGALAGEHTFNVGLTDRIQNLISSRLPGWLRKYATSEHKLAEIMRYPEFDQCHANEPTSSRYAYWNCIGFIWNRDFRKQTRYGVTYPDDGLAQMFFNPVGSTYGLGQLGPLRALQLTDIVNKVTGGAYPLLSLDNIDEVYRSILDPETTIHYIAANITVGLHYYRRVAFIDISNNPGLTATLYNLGNEQGKATELKNENLRRLRSGRTFQLPSENYYGWLINEKRADLQALLDSH